MKATRPSLPPAYIHIAIEQLHFPIGQVPGVGERFDAAAAHRCLPLAAAYQPQLLGEVRPQRPSLPRRALDLLGDAFLLALGGRVWNEGLGLLRNEVQAKRNAVEATEEPTAPRNVFEPGRSAYPGISVR